jgi:uroporphyrinogen-III synthase
VELGKRGARVDVVEAYRTVTPEGAAEQARAVLARRPHCITFTSSSTVQNFVAVAGAEALRGVKAVSIGPVTTETARRCGIEVAAQAREYTIDGLLGAVVEMCETELTPPTSTGE